MYLDSKACYMPAFEMIYWFSMPRSPKLVPWKSIIWG